MKRLEQKQDGLKDSIKNAITIGLEEIKGRVSSISLTDIVDQIPVNFRADLERELQGASDRAVGYLATKFRELPAGTINISEEIRDALLDHVDEAVSQAAKRFARHPFGVDDQAVEYLAKRIAYHLHYHRPW
jgi:hypothetical protein